MDDEQRARIRAEREELLTSRLDESLLKRAASIGEHCTVENLHELGLFIEMHRYLTEEHTFEESEVERLLRFQDPLEAVTESAGPGGEIRNVNLDFYLDRADAEAVYPLIQDSALPESVPARPPEPKRPVKRPKERQRAVK